MSSISLERNNINMYLGLMAVVTIISHFFFITLVFIIFQGLRLDYFFSKEKQGKFRLALVLFSVAIGYLASEFFLSFIDSIRNLLFLIK